MAGITKTVSVNHLRAWREHRDMSQTELAKRIDTSSSVISEIESGTLGLSPKWLRRLAPALGITVGILLEHHPDEVDAQVLELFNQIPEENRKLALDVLRSFVPAA